MSKRKRQFGASLLEFTLVGVPVIFAMISLAEISRGMWNYHTLANSVQDAGRWLAVRGQGGCAAGSCVTVGKIAQRIGTTAIGVPASQLNVVLTSGTGESVTCNPLKSCYANATQWPPQDGNAPGMSITVQATYPFSSAIAMFFPGKHPTRVGTINLSASSTQPILF